MRILIATPIYPPEIGGPATYTKELANQLVGKHNLIIVAYTDVRDPWPDTKLVSISKQQPLLIRLSKFFWAILKESKSVDLIYVQNAMAAGLPVAIVSMLTGKPFVLKFVGDEAWERATQRKETEKRLQEFLAEPEGSWMIKVMSMIQGFVLRQANIVTTPSAYLSQELIRAYHVNPSKTVVNYNAAEETEKLPFEVSKKKHQIATTARLVNWKGVDGIIKAVKIIKEKYQDARLVVAGDGPEKESLLNLVKELKLEDSVEFLGQVSRAETWRLRQTSEVYVLNSTYEGLPHTVLTSFAAEIPTVATDIPGTNEAVYHENTGLLVKPEHPEEVAAAVERLFKDEELQKQLVVNGKKLLEEKFSWKAHLDTLEAIFKRVLARAN